MRIALRCKTHHLPACPRCGAEWREAPGPDPVKAAKIKARQILASIHARNREIKTKAKEQGTWPRR